MSSPVVSRDIVASSELDGLDELLSAVSLGSQEESQVATKPRMSPRKKRSPQNDIIEIKRPFDEKDDDEDPSQYRYQLINSDHVFLKDKRVLLTQILGEEMEVAVTKGMEMI